MVNATSFHIFSEDFVQEEPRDHKCELVLCAAMQKQRPGCYVGIVIHVTFGALWVKQVGTNMTAKGDADGHRQRVAMP